MHEKKINLDQTAFELIANYPELKELLFELGFKDIIKPLMLASVGKIMTLRKGALMRGVSLATIVDKLEENDFIVTEE